MACQLSAIMARAPPEVQAKLQSLSFSQVEFHAEKLVRTLMGRPNHCSTLSNYVTGKDSEGYDFGRQKSFRFRLIPEERGFPNSVLYDYIVTSGGSVTREADDPYAVTILNDLYFILREDEDIVLPPDCYSSSLIYEAIKREMFDLALPDPKPLLLSPSKYAPYDLWKILRREVKWSDLKKSRKKVERSESERVTARESARVIYEILSAGKDSILKWKQICGIEPSTSTSSSPVAVVPSNSTSTNKVAHGGNQEKSSSTSSSQEVEKAPAGPNISVGRKNRREDNAASATDGDGATIPVERESGEEGVVPAAATTSLAKEILRQKSNATAAATTSSPGRDHPKIIVTRTRRGNPNDDDNDDQVNAAVATATLTTSVSVEVTQAPIPNPEVDQEVDEGSEEEPVTPKRKKKTTTAATTEMPSSSPPPPQRNSEIEVLESSLIMNTPESQTTRDGERQIQVVTQQRRIPDMDVICCVPSAPNSHDRNEGRRFRLVGGRPVTVRDPVKIVQKAVAGPLKRKVHKKKSVPCPDEDGWIDPVVGGVEATKRANANDNDEILDVTQLVDVQFSEGEDENQESFIPRQIRESRRPRQPSCLTSQKLHFAEVEEFLIVRKICEVKAFRYTGGRNLYIDMAKSKDFMNRRTGGALRDRFRKYIRPKLLDETKRKAFAEKCGISSEDVKELLNGLKITSLTKHRNFTPKFKFD